MNQQFADNSLKLNDLFIDEKDFGIVLGNHQSLDTVAAALALYLSLQQSGKNVQIVSIKEPLVEVSSLIGVDKIKKSFSGDTTKLIVSLPYKKGEVEKVLFTEQQDTINFHLTAAQGRTITPFELSQVKLNWEGGASPKNIIAVGIGNESEFDSLINFTDSKIVNIDNYQNNSRYGDIVLVDESYSSLCEIAGKIIKDQRLPFDQDIAQNILDGVLYATRNFTKGNTSPVAFETASYAMYQGAQRKSDNPNQRQQSSQNTSYNQNRPFDVASPRYDPVADQQQGRQNRQNSGNMRRDRGSFGQTQGKQNRNQRVQNNDFPAMHIQNIRDQIANDRRQQSNRQNQMPQRNFNQPYEDVNPQPQRDNYEPEAVEDPQAITEPQMTQNQDFQDTQMPPFDQSQGKQDQSYESPRNEDVPDDWLMPKVFKSSKNNN